MFVLCKWVFDYVLLHGNISPSSFSRECFIQPLNTDLAPDPSSQQCFTPGLRDFFAAVIDTQGGSLKVCICKILCQKDPSFFPFTYLFIFIDDWHAVLYRLSCATLSRSVMSNSLWPHGLQPPRLLCPWGFSREKYWRGLPCPPPGII